MDKTSKRHELRDAFYRDMRRQPGERVDSFQIRFEKELTDLDALEVRFEDADKAYFLRDGLAWARIRSATNCWIRRPVQIHRTRF